MISKDDLRMGYNDLGALRCIHLILFEVHPFLDLDAPHAVSLISTINKRVQ